MLFKCDCLNLGLSQIDSDASKNCDAASQSENMVLPAWPFPLFWNVSGTDPLSPLQTTALCPWHYSHNKGLEYRNIPLIWFNLGGKHCLSPWGKLQYFWNLQSRANTMFWVEIWCKFQQYWSLHPYYVELDDHIIAEKFLRCCFFHHSKILTR